MRHGLFVATLFALACTGDKVRTADTGASADTGSDGTPDAPCTAGPDNLEGLAVAFARSSTEVETYRFGTGTFVRDLMAGEASENTGTRAWSGTPDCRLDLAHAEVPPDWPDAFTSVYLLEWTSPTDGTFSVTRTFADGFTYSGTGTLLVVP